MRTWSLVLATLLAGCVTQERPLGAAKPELAPVDEAPAPLAQREQQLKDAVEDAPDDPRARAAAWFALGDFYEDTMRYAEALPAYGRMHEEIQRLPDGSRYTAGHYHLGRILARLKDYPGAVEHLRAVLALEPKDRQQAALYAHFRESHYLLGVVYYNSHQWGPAQEHLTAFKEMGGEPERVDSLLMNIAYEKKGS